MAAPVLLTLMGSSGSRKYEVPSGVESEKQPGSRGRVLSNLLGIHHKLAMDRAEFAALLRAQESYIHRITEDTRFTELLLCEMHREWLGHIYKWAGCYRTVELSKGGFRWPPARLIERNMVGFEKGMLAEQTPCRPNSLYVVTRRIAEVHAEFLLIHPFRDGNGRMARWVAGLMALQAGFPTPKYRFEGVGSRKERLNYLNAVQRGYMRDYARLSDFFRDAILRRLDKRE